MTDTVRLTIKFWVVNIYVRGEFDRKIEATFTEVTAGIFCNSFNRVQNIFVAVAKEHTTVAELSIPFQY